MQERWFKTTAGVNMPQIIYGTAWKKERTTDLVVKAILAGFRGIDTACQPRHYSEPLVGEAIHKLKDHGIKREDLFVQTKFTPPAGQDPENIPYDKDAPIESQISQSFDASQRNLQTPYVDSLVLHSPIAPTSLLLEAWQAMEAIHEAGHARQLGISNCYDLGLLQQLYADAKVKPAVVQNRFYPQTGYDAALRGWCAEQGLIYQSFWTLTANPHLLTSAVIRALSQEYDRTEAQILFRYLTQSGIAPLTGTSSEQHMVEDLGIFDFKLTSEQRGNITSLLMSYR